MSYFKIKITNILKKIVQYSKCLKEATQTLMPSSMWLSFKCVMKTKTVKNKDLRPILVFVITKTKPPPQFVLDPSKTKKNRKKELLFYQY